MRLTNTLKGNLRAGVILGAAIWFAAASAGFCENTNVIIPILQMEDVPITSVIENLARLAGQNYLLDPRLYGPTANGPWHDRDGRVISEPLLSFKWEHLTAPQALARLLQESDLHAVEMQNTPILQISHLPRDAGIVDASLLGNDTNAPVPVIAMRSVAIGTALKRLAAAAGLKVVIDPKLFKFVDAEEVSSTLISFRWEGVTPRQGIVALCENYGLDLIKNSTTGVVRIEPKR